MVTKSKINMLTCIFTSERASEVVKIKKIEFITEKIQYISFKYRKKIGETSTKLLAVFKPWQTSSVIHRSTDINTEVIEYKTSKSKITLYISGWHQMPTAKYK